MASHLKFIFKLCLLAGFLGHANADAFVRTRWSSAGTKLYWAQKDLPLRWALDIEANPSNLGHRMMNEALSRAYAAWAAIGYSRLSFAQQADNLYVATPFYVSAGESDPVLGLNSHMMISDDWPFDSHTIAVTIAFPKKAGGGIAVYDSDDLLDGSLMDADILFNDVNFDYCVTGLTDCVDAQGRAKMDLVTVATHEIGHQIGFDHTTNPQSIMYPSISLGQVKALSSDETAAVQCVYATSDSAVKKSACAQEMNSGAVPGSDSYFTTIPGNDNSGSCAGVTPISGGRNGPRAGNAAFNFALMWILLFIARTFVRTPKRQTVV
jgi:hypothetical protein